jgi:hypothetical protein
MFVREHLFDLLPPLLPPKGNTFFIVGDDPDLRLAGSSTMLSAATEAPMLRRILSAIAGALQFVFSLADGIVDGFLIAARLKPSVPPAQMSPADIDQISRSNAKVSRLQDEATVKRWAAARLYGRPFELPARPIGQWLMALTVDDAGRVAACDGAGGLRDHLSGQRLFAGLPPVGSFEDTRRWRSRHAPRRYRHTGLEDLATVAPNPVLMVATVSPNPGAVPLSAYAR